MKRIDAFRLLLISALLLPLGDSLCAQVDAGPVTIEGSAPEWAGEVIRLVEWTDPISRTEKTLAEDTLSAEGEFSLRFTIDTPGRFFLVVRRFRALLYAAPGGEYRVAIPSHPLHARMPSWQPGEFEYFFIDLPDDDVNTSIHRIDSLHYDFFLNYVERAGFSGIRRGVLEFEENILNDHARGEYGTRPFVDTYFVYSLATTKMLARFPKKELFTQYIQNRPLAPSHPMWYSFFDALFADYFQSYDVRFGGENIANRMRRGLTPEGLDSLLRKDDFLQNDTLRQLVTLKSVNESFFGKSFPKPALVSVVEYIHRHPAEAYIEKVAELLLRKMKRNHPSPAELLQAVGMENHPRDTSKAAVFMISASWSTASQNESAVLEKLVEKYPESLEVVEISIDGEKSASWPVAIPADTYAFLENFQVYALPVFYYIPPGSDVLQEIPRPSEGLESKLYAIKVKRESRNKIRVGQ